MMADLLKDDYNRHQELTNPDDIDFTEIGRAARIYKSLWNHVYSIYQALTPDGVNRDRELALRELAKKRVEVDFFLRLEHRLYPWVHHHRKTAFTLYESYSGQGFVLCAVNGQFEFVAASIQAIRSKLKSNFPVQVFYINHWDLSKERRALREMTHGIEVSDISTILDNGIMKLGGWSIKVFSILASKFEEVIMIDSDVFFSGPDELFIDPGYQAIGALFFYDRTLSGDSRAGPDIIRSVVPFMSNFPKSTLNSKYERDLWSYKKFNGDKEIFWSGFEIVQEPYAFIATMAIGELREDDFGLWHPVASELSWKATLVGGGVMRNKNEVRQEGPGDPVWDFRPSCLTMWRVNSLGEHQSSLATSYVRLDKVAIEVETKMKAMSIHSSLAQIPVRTFTKHIIPVFRHSPPRSNDHARNQLYSEIGDYRYWFSVYMVLD
ncbi:MAG: mannosyltransferase putative-domain-containing protein [Benniella sp.]|nr:MAG: mannosyltransferase putative-domain-containing protein [Benniella sp.]